MKLLVLPCDGIGPEIIAASMQALEVADSKFGLGLSLEYDDAGFVSLEKYGTTLRDSVLEQDRAPRLRARVEAPGEGDRRSQGEQLPSDRRFVSPGSPEGRSGVPRCPARRPPD